jgi:vesicle-associated membrane protein 7
MSSNVFVYGLVAYGSTPLAEYAAFEGNFKQFAIAMLDQIDPTQTYSQSASENHVFFALNEPSRMIYLCLTDKKASEILRKNFLDELRNKWHAKYGNTGEKMRPYEKSSEFGPEIKRIFGTYNSDRAQKIAQVKENIQKTQDATTQNLTLALARGEQLEIMSQKADKIKDSATAFHREAKNVSRMMCWQKWRWYVIGGVIIAVVIFIILLIACGGFAFKKCKK